MDDSITENENGGPGNSSSAGAAPDAGDAFDPENTVDAKNAADAADANGVDDATASDDGHHFIDTCYTGDACDLENTVDTGNVADPVDKADANGASHYVAAHDTGDAFDNAGGTGVSLLKILFTFLKIGAFTFGGGYAILPVIRREITSRWEQIDSKSFMDILVIAQGFPGSLALNCSIIVGRLLRGTPGGLTAALGILIPSFFTILVLAAFLLPVVQGNQFVQAVFYGLRPAVVALVAAAAWDLGREFTRDRFGIFVVVLLLAVALVFRLHPVFILVLGAALGLFYF